MCVCVRACVHVSMFLCVYAFMHECVCMYVCASICVHVSVLLLLLFYCVVDRIIRSSKIIKMVVLSGIQYNDKEVKNSTIGCMLFLYH